MKQARKLASGLLLGLLATVGCNSGPNVPGAEQPQPLWTHADASGARALPYADGELAIFTTAFARRVVALDVRSGERRWTRELTSGPSGLGLPTGNVLAHASLILVPGWDLYALDRASGQVRWTFAPGEEYPAGASIAIEGDRVVSPGGERTLYGVDARTGAQLWKTDLRERPFAPVVEGGVAYLGTRGYVDNSNVLGAGHALAVQMQDGQVLWRAPIPDASDTPWRGGTNRSGALTPELFIVASPNGRIYGIERQTGRVRWEHRGPGPYESGVVVLGGVAVAASVTGEIVGLHAGTGGVRWRATTGGSSVTQQLTTDGTCAYVSVGGIMCVDATGKVRWDRGGAANGGPSYLTPVQIAGNRLFAGSTTGFHALVLPR